MSNSKFYETPNPATLKLIPENFITNRIGEYKAINNKNPILVNKLLSKKDIKSVFIGQRFISVTKKENSTWMDLQYDIFNIVEMYKEEISITEKELSEKIVTTEATTALEIKICEILDAKIKPAVERDGGYIKFISYDIDMKIVYISLQGACASCPHSKMTLNNGVLSTLKYFLPNDVVDVKQV